jgi:hypothetical protein
LTFVILDRSADEAHDRDRDPLLKLEILRDLSKRLTGDRRDRCRPAEQSA